MPRHSRYQLPRTRKRGGGPFLWLLVFLLLGIVAWVWWQAGKSTLRPSLQNSRSSKRQTHAPTPTHESNDHGATAAPPQADLPKPALLTTTNLVSPESVGARANEAKTNIPPRTNTSQAPTKPATNGTSVVTRIEPSVPPPRSVTNTTKIGPGGFPRPARDTMELQVALARQGISPGSVDGVMGSQTRAALVAFQRREGLPPTGALDAVTRESLLLAYPPLTSYTVTSNDLARPQPLSKTWLGKSQQRVLEYETILELVAEKGQASPNLVRRLNPGVDWTNLVAGTEVSLPDITNAPSAGRAGLVVISLGEKKLQAFDDRTNLLAHFPCSIAARVEKRPAGELRVTAVAPHPDYTFNPEVFPESAEARQIKTKLMIPPGPNNPVGTAWISLDLPGYGIHGTPSPEQVGRTESHGCFRLANWNAEYLLKLVWVGMPVYVAP